MTDNIDYEALGSVVRLAHHDVVGLDAEARAIVAAYQAQQRARGVVEVRAEDVGRLTNAVVFLAQLPGDLSSGTTAALARLSDALAHAEESR